MELFAQEGGGWGFPNEHFALVSDMELESGKSRTGCGGGPGLRTDGFPDPENESFPEAGRC
jgi:hypothetical protein